MISANFLMFLKGIPAKLFGKSQKIMEIIVLAGLGSLNRGFTKCPEDVLTIGPKVIMAKINKE